nr:hypothetical protein Q903MT_gene5328 [Picea sitchensis]
MLAVLPLPVQLLLPLLLLRLPTFASVTDAPGSDAVGIGAG